MALPPTSVTPVASLATGVSFTRRPALEAARFLFEQAANAARLIVVYERSDALLRNFYSRVWLHPHQSGALSTLSAGRRWRVLLCR